MEEVFETLETACVYMTTERSSTMIEPISNRNFCDTFNKRNGQTQLQNFHKHIVKQYQYILFQI